jgi:hypothetical protein
MDLKAAPSNGNNTPRLAPSTLEIERLRMQMAMQKVANGSCNDTGNSNNGGGGGSGNGNGNVDTVGEIPTMSRGVRRFKSSNPNVVGRNASGTLAAPTKSTDAAASLRGSAVARANSSRNLLQRNTSSNAIPRNGLPARTTSSQGLRSFHKDQIVNHSISRKPSTDGILNMHIRGPGGTLGLQRGESEMSLGEVSISDGSFFTTDSVYVRKAQFIADPIDNEDSNAYYDDDSFADHESFMTRDTDAHLLYETPANLVQQKPDSSMVPPAAIQTTMTLNDLQSLKLNRMNISSGINDDISLISYGTMASGLTIEFTENDNSYTDGYVLDEETEHNE